MHKNDTAILFLKGLFSAVQIGTGVLALFIGFEKIQSFLIFIAGRELSEDSTDFIALHMLDFANNISLSVGTFIALYIIVEGATKLLLIWGVYKENKIIIPIAFIIFGLVILYQVYLLITGHSLYIIGFILLDSLLLWVIWKEYKKILNKF
ncbi:DUF2127 domain-containing protein [Candidatus Gracilibacteria bacterium]|nr:DUF2127 domain-containing protein [Candidatus Gracilibacteria bacterium]